MGNFRITAILILAVLLQWSARGVWEPLRYIDFFLIAIVYAAFQRNAIKAIVLGSLLGIAVDALSGGLLGANGFTKTLIAYSVSEIARRVYMDNLMLRIPVLILSSAIGNLLFVGLNTMFGSAPAEPLGMTLLISVIATSITGTALLFLFDRLFSQTASGSGGEGFFERRRRLRRRSRVSLKRR